MSQAARFEVPKGQILIKIKILQHKFALIGIILINFLNLFKI